MLLHGESATLVLELETELVEPLFAFGEFLTQQRLTFAKGQNPANHRLLGVMASGDPDRIDPRPVALPDLDRDADAARQFLGAAPNLCLVEACFLVDPAYPAARRYVLLEREDLALPQFQDVEKSRL